MKPNHIFLFLILGLNLSSLKAQDFYFTLNYSTAAPLGETNDYISNYSWRGISMEGNWELNEKVAAGFNIGWNVFFQNISDSFTSDTRTVTGTQLRYINAFPLQVTGRYHFGVVDATRPYLGLGVGTTRTRQRTDMGIFTTEPSAWQFSLAPGAGVLIPVGFSTRINLGVQYQYAFETSDMMANSYLVINLGFVWDN